MTQLDPAQALRNSADQPAAFAVFYEVFFERILVYLTRRVFDPDVALDLTAESFAQAYLSRGRFRGSVPAEAEAWIYRIAQRKLARYFRRRTVERRAMNRLQIEAPQLDAERRCRIEELAELDGLRSALHSALTQVSPAQREAVRLRALEELPYAEIATRLEITEQAARARVSRGLKRLAVALDESSIPEEVRT